MSYVNVLVQISRLDLPLLKHKQTSKEMDIIGNNFTNFEGRLLAWEKKYSDIKYLLE